MIKTIEQFKSYPALKVVPAACKRWLLMRGSSYNNLTGKISIGISEKWLLRRGSRLREVVANGGLTVYLYIEYNVHA